MLDLMWYFLPMIFFLGIVTSYQDIKIGKIRNEWIVLALIYALLVNLVLMLYINFTMGVRFHYIYELITNVIFSVLVGFGLWYFKVWSAADGKLFIAFSALLPLSVYNLGYQEWVPFFTLLVNIFIVALIVMVIYMFFHAKLKSIYISLKAFSLDFFHPKQFLDSAVYLFAIYWIIQILLSFIGLSSNFIITAGLTMIFFALVKNKLGKRSLYLVFGIVALRFFIDKSVYTFDFWLDFIILVFVWRLLRSFLMGTTSALGAEIFSDEVSLSKLKPGMIMVEPIFKLNHLNEDDSSQLKKNKVEVIKKNGFYYFNSSKPLKGSIEVVQNEPEGLTQKQLDKIKYLDFQKIKVAHAIPFAPFIFIGVIITLLIKGNILILVRVLLFGF